MEILHALVLRNQAATLSCLLVVSMEIMVHLRIFPSTMYPRGQSFHKLGRAVLSERRRNVGTSPRFNPLGIQMLSEPLHNHLFGTKESKVTSEQIELSRKHLETQGLWGKDVPVMPDVDFELPKLEGTNIDKHFRAIAKQQLAPYLPLVDRLCKARLPSMPTKWSYSPGWTKYEGNNSSPVDYPDSDALVFDAEVCVSEGPLPTMATAVSPTCWYSWVSNRLTRDQDYATQGKRIAPDDMIPLETQSGSTEPPSGSWREKLIVGHNVSYDRARIKEQYLLAGPKTRFLDTLSLHVCVAGQTSHQQVLWKAFNKRDNNDEEVTKKKLLWMLASSPNSLKEAYKLHCDGDDMDKTKRSTFVEGSMSDIREDFQNLMTYCAKDVVCTHKLLKAIFPKFSYFCPHPVTLAGMFEMGSAILPVNQSWEEYVAGGEYMYEDMQHVMKVKLMSVAKQAARFMKNEKYKDDIWLSQLDWSVKSLRNKTMTKTQMEKLLRQLKEDEKLREAHFQSLGTEEETDYDTEYKFLISSTDPSCIKRNVHLPGYPQWYRALCPRLDGPSWQPGPANISPQMRLVPYLLRMKWNGHPLHWHAKMGWGYLVAVDGGDNTVEEVKSPLNFPLDEISDEILSEAGESGTNLSQYEESQPLTKQKKDPKVKPNDILTLNERKYYFYKIPHKNGPRANCGSPLSKDYIHKMEGGILTSSAGRHGSKILQLNSAISFWRSARSRILDQFVVWHDPESYCSQGCILPMVRVAGTVTRRAVEATWLTASNAKESRVGSELKSLVRAPPGYHLVGADVDSQELWIASILGDTNFTGLHGCTALSWMTLQGNKSEGTDLHSTTARTIGINRDQAKILNYGRFYGAGRPFVELLLKQFNPSLSGAEVTEKATQLYSVTKGVRRYILTMKAVREAKKLNLSVGDDLSLDGPNLTLLRDHIKQNNGKLWKVVKSTYWSGGSESYTFNKLEELALSSEHYPETPVLGCKISQALSPLNVKNEFVTSRVNWAVQSSAVDYLHLTLVCMKWLMDTYDIDGRFCISIHDEVRYLVRSEDRYRAALALQISNLLTRSMFSYKLGMKDLPQSVAFFSSVDVDSVLRKEVTMDCVTPSNRLGLSEGHGIPHGESLDVHQILEKTSGSLKP